MTRPSATDVTIFTHKTCGAVIGAVKAKRIATAITAPWATLVGRIEKHGLFDIVVDSAPFLHRRRDRREIVVGKDHSRRFFRHLGALDAHCDADVGPF